MNGKISHLVQTEPNYETPLETKNPHTLQSDEAGTTQLQAGVQSG